MVGGGGTGMKWRGTPMPSAFHIYVPDCDATYARALEAGATSIQQADRSALRRASRSVKDAAGNSWYIATYKGESYQWEGAPTLQPYLHPLRAEPVINFVKRAFGAEELGRYATPDGVIHHTTMKIGNAHMEMGEAQGPYQPMPTMFYLYVEDCDALYKRALAAGATSISEPTGSTLRRPQRRRNRSLRQQVVHRHPYQRHVGASVLARAGTSTACVGTAAPAVRSSAARRFCLRFSNPQLRSFAPPDSRGRLSPRGCCHCRTSGTLAPTSAIAAALRTRSWLLSGWEHPGRHLSTARRNPGRRCGRRHCLL